MKRIKFLLLSLGCTVSVFAQLSGDGFYRVQNVAQERYISVIDNRGSVNVSTTDADFGALRTVLGFERVVSDPSSVIYIRNMGAGYDLQCQGTGSYSITGYLLQIRSAPTGYYAYATNSGMTKFLGDDLITAFTEDPTYGSLVTNSNTTRQWYIMPVEAGGSNYFGLTPDVMSGGNYYTTFFAAFPFTFNSSGMTAYFVNKVDEKKSAVVIQEISGGVPSSVPVLVKCSSNQAASNKLNVGASASGSASGNLLKGVYFCNDVPQTASYNHRNVVDYDAATMRVLGTAPDGSLAFIKANNLNYIPANTAYIQVSASAPAVLKVYSQTEYEQLPDVVNVIVNDATREYGEENPTFTYTVEPENIDLTGKLILTCNATEKSGVGEYAITATSSVTDMTVTCVDGKLTITKAPLQVKAADVTWRSGDEWPVFELSYEGFKNNENEDVLTKKPEATTTATKDSPEGTYAITVSGGEAVNYTFSYAEGTLTVLPPKEVIVETGATYEVEDDNTVTFTGLEEESATEPVTVCDIPEIVTFEGKTYPVTSIAAEAFKGIETLEQVSIPQSVESIGKAAFAGCKGLKTIVIYVEDPIDLSAVAAARGAKAAAGSVFEGVDLDECVLFVPVGSVEKYRAAEVWKEFTQILPMTSLGVSTLSVNVTSDCDIYDLQGRKVRAGSTLAKGMYIIGGRKVVIK